MSPSRARPRFAWAHWPAILAALFLGVIVMCAALLEARFVPFERSEITVGDTPVTLLQSPSDAPQPLVLIAHGFGGSRQMMDQIAVTLARQGLATASFDFPGHGRHPGALSRDITRIEGTTAQLVAETEAVIAALLARDEIAGPVSLVGHSMATDVIVRAMDGATQAGAEEGAVVAISMYSPAVSETDPRDLLIISGAQESHLRTAALEAVRQIAPEANESETIAQGEMRRAAEVAPFVGHVGVLYHPATLRHLSDWVGETLGQATRGSIDRSGVIVGLLLAAAIGFCWAAMRALPKRPTEGSAVPTRVFWTALAAPVIPVILTPLLVDLGVGGLAGFGTLALILCLWGAVQLALLLRAGLPVPKVDVTGSLALAAVGLVFALLLDRFGAHFLPTGPRLSVMAVLVLASVPLMLADTMLIQGAGLVRRIAARAALVVALGLAMSMAPTELGLTFTVLPVLVLFFLVYGSFARWCAARRGAGAVPLVHGLMLAWALAASTPLFAVGG